MFSNNFIFDNFDNFLNSLNKENCPSFAVITDIKDQPSLLYTKQAFKDRIENKFPESSIDFVVLDKDWKESEIIEKLKNSFFLLKDKNIIVFYLHSFCVIYHVGRYFSNPIFQPILFVSPTNEVHVLEKSVYNP